MVNRVFDQFRRGIDHDYGAATALSLGALVAIAWSALWPHAYFSLTASSTAASWARHFNLSSFHQFVVDGLLTIFFFAIGLELRRELQTGALGHARRAVTPVAGALGGMAATALASLLLGVLWHNDALRRGWGVPMATDIAFTLGALALMGRKLPPTLRLFVLTLAIADDVFSVIVLLFTGASRLAPWWLLAVGAVLALSWRVGRRPHSAAASAGTLLVLWFCFTQAHLEPALAGVLAGVLIASKNPVHARLERIATRLSTAIVLPLFGLVAVGIHWSQLHLSGPTGTIIAATILIRVVGKVGGICGGVFLATRLGFSLPHAVTRTMIVAVSTLCAMGLTVPLLFAARLFGATSTPYAAFSLGLLLSTVLAGLFGLLALRTTVK